MEQVRVTTITKFVEASSSIKLGKYIFEYVITIKNTSKQNLQLISKRWFITDANMQTGTAHSIGVAKEQPMLKPEQSYKYSSWVSLPTPVGCMYGKYFFLDRQNEILEVNIPAFSLAVPHMIH